MATATTTQNSQITDPPPYCVYGEAMFGSNGELGGPAEVYVGHDGTDATATRRVWTSDLSGGLASGWMTVEWVGAAGGGTAGVQWAVDGADVEPLSYTGTTYGAIGTVRFRAGVRTGARVAWRNVAVKWYRSGRLTETFAAAAGPSVDTRSAGSPPAAEQTLAVVPAISTHTRVVVSGEIAFDFPAGAVPEANDLFAQVLVSAANCAQL